jgi:transcriptional regulator with GAF, ATPase, and Fis domain
LAHSFDQSSSMLEGPARTHAEASILMRRFSESLVAKQQSTALEDEQKTSDEKNEDFASPSFNNTTEYGLSSDDEDTTVSSSAVMVSTPNGLGLMELPPTISLSSFRKTNERQVILAALESAPTKAEAARRLGISPRTLRYKMAQLRMAGAA